MNAGTNNIVGKAYTLEYIMERQDALRKEIMKGDEAAAAEYKMLSKEYEKLTGEKEPGL